MYALFSLTLEQIITQNGTIEVCTIEFPHKFVQ